MMLNTTTKAEEFTRAALANLGRDMPVTREIALGDETAIDATRLLLDSAADSFIAQLREITARRLK